MRTQLTRVSAVVFVVAAFSGCNRASPSVDAARPAASVLAKGAAEEPLVVGFSDPVNAGIFAYAKREGILERELAKVNASIRWVPGAGAFSASADAMNTGVMNAAGGAIIYATQPPGPTLGTLDGR